TITGRIGHGTGRKHARLSTGGQEVCYGLCRSERQGVVATDREPIGERGGEIGVQVNTGSVPVRWCSPTAHGLGTQLAFLRFGATLDGEIFLHRTLVFIEHRYPVVTADQPRNALGGGPGAPDHP